jgi:hypothetical protein
VTERVEESADKPEMEETRADVTRSEETRQPVRNERGRFESAEEYQRRIKELNDENAARRRENKELKAAVEAIRGRTLMSEVRAALLERNADPAFVKYGLDGIIKSYGIALNEHFEVVGLNEAIEKLEKDAPSVFRAKVEKAMEEMKSEEPEDKKNSTAKGPSISGSGDSGKSNPMGLPDLRKLKTKEEREKAFEAWRLSLKHR